MEEKQGNIDAHAPVQTIQELIYAQSIDGRPPLAQEINEFVVKSRTKFVDRYLDGSSPKQLVAIERFLVNVIEEEILEVLKRKQDKDYEMAIYILTPRTEGGGVASKEEGMYLLNAWYIFDHFYDRFLLVAKGVLNIDAQFEIDVCTLLISAFQAGLADLLGWYKEEIQGLSLP